MSPETIFNTHLFLGYVAWLLCFGVYVMPRLKSMDLVAAQRSTSTLHSFRFFGLVFILPGVVGPNLPAITRTETSCCSSLRNWHRSATEIKLNRKFLLLNRKHRAHIRNNFPDSDRCIALVA
jgi:hypothetical protein